MLRTYITELSSVNRDSEHLHLEWGKDARIFLAAQQQTSESLTSQKRLWSQIYRKLSRGAAHTTTGTQPQVPGRQWESRETIHGPQHPRTQYTLPVWAAHPTWPPGWFCPPAAGGGGTGGAGACTPRLGLGELLGRQGATTEGELGLRYWKGIWAASLSSSISCGRIKLEKLLRNKWQLFFFFPFPIC